LLPGFLFIKTARRLERVFVFAWRIGKSANKRMRVLFPIAAGLAAIVIASTIAEINL
jgi:hypothetical protein